MTYAYKNRAESCRFGDPETQVVLPLLESDLLTIMKAVTDGNLENVDIRFSDRSACCVIMAADGYPVKYEKGKEIFIPSEIKDKVYVAGAKKKTEGFLQTVAGFWGSPLWPMI